MSGLPDNWPDGRFSAILADPPWHFKTYNEKGRNRCPDWQTFKGSPCRHYGTMSLAEIKALPVAELAADDCALFLWTCWPMLEQSLDVMEAWGFTYKTAAFAWMKSNGDGTIYTGLGYWTRANTEMCLLATRGKPKRLRKDVKQGIIAPRREHSRKPDVVHERIERLVAGPYLELFARETRPNWTAWGNETAKYSVAAE